MANRIFRATICFGVAALAYWGYALAVVPLIEPEVTAHQKVDETLSERPTIHGLEKYFLADAWERDDPKVLETENGALLFRDYLPRDDGTIELKPVTLILYPDGDPSKNAPVVVQAPNGAILKSDRAINLARADFGKPIAGRLQGNVTIRRPRTNPQQDDELYVVTRNVQIDQQRIWTPNEVEFRFGPHWGRGRDLQIRFHENDARTALLKKQSGVVRELELAQIEKVLISIDDRTMSRALAGKTPIGNSPSADQQATDQPVTGPSTTGQSTTGQTTAGPSTTVPSTDFRPSGPPVELRSRGPFRFHFVEQTAVLSDHVTLTRKFPGGLVDSLSCELLEIHFDPGEAAATGAPTLGPTELLVDRILAKGTPVVFEFPSQQAFARADLVECFYAQRRIVLEGATGAWLKRGSDEMEAIRLDYTFHPDDPRRPGQLTAEGAGRVVGGASDQGRFTASWTQSLQLRPHEGRQLLSVVGNAKVAFENTGSFSAQQIHFFLQETSDTQAGTGQLEPATKPLVPDRLVAQGDVLIDSPWLRSSQPSRELKVWFVPVTAPPAPHSTPGEANSSPGGTPSAGGNPGPRRRPDGPPLEFRGEVVEVRVLATDSMKLDDVTVAGQVVITRASASVDGLPVKIAGDLLQISGLSENRATVQVQGKPAEASAEGVTIQGERIHCDQAANRMWIPGRGRMLTPKELRTTAANARSLPPMEITWTDSLEFDGSAAIFHGQVEARGLHLAQNGELSEFRVRGLEMQADLTRRISFVDPPTESHPTDVDMRLLSFRGEVLAENRTKLPDGSPKSWEEMQVVDLKIDKAGGILSAVGPGKLSSVRAGGTMNSYVRPPGSPPAPALPAGNSSQLMHIQVRFAGSMSAQLGAKDVEFVERVRATYVPVQRWEERFDPDRQDLGAEGLEMLSDRLKLTEVPGLGPQQAAHHELLATGNVQVRGESFRATGHRLSYDDGKDLLILEGVGRDLAVIRAAWGNGNAEARVIKIWPKSKRVQSEGIRSLDFGPVSNQR